MRHQIQGGFFKNRLIRILAFVSIGFVKPLKHLMIIVFVIPMRAGNIVDIDFYFHVLAIGFKDFTHYVEIACSL